MIRLAALILLSTASLIQTGDASRQISLTVAELGHDVTLHCNVSENAKWYKQSLGQMPQTVAIRVSGQTITEKQFRNSHFTVTTKESQFSLSIRNVSKEDEATYFCQTVTAFSSVFVNGTFLVVNDSNQQKSVFVTQSPKTESVQLGDTATLHCSLLSKETQSNVQCPGEHSVYWFRTGSGGFHPNIIYTQRNSSDEDTGRSCDYRLSKTMRDSADTGTYYCAVVTCGQILLGEGTTVETSETSASCDLRHDKSTVDQSHNQDDEEEELNYAAVHFSNRGPKREEKKKKKKQRESPEESLYSVVKCQN
ncbi:immunoglobulin kappa light chain-like [Parambassis ranga]|uniref:immunoglobulin kappa light chain-like n=1 Tax=Parambassis ranga TaxID=210632 RepID=UPI0010427528|nr:immunoglobulin kappa light chain-like [Parambassis ranga]